MKKILYTLLAFMPILSVAQKDFSKQWKDLYSYNDVKDFVIVNNTAYAITDNAMFTYDIDAKQIKKISSVNGFSGFETSSISFDRETQKIIVGYKNGLIDLITTDGQVIPFTGIKDNLILVDKAVNGIYTGKDNTYAYGDFGIVELDLENNQFGNSYKLSSLDQPEGVSGLSVINNILYAATARGLYSIDLTTDLNPVDFTNWTLIKAGNITNVIEITDNLYFSIDSSVYHLENVDTSLIDAPANILNLSMSNLEKHLVVSMSDKINVYDTIVFNKQHEVDLSGDATYDFTTNKAVVNNGSLYLATSKFGLLSTPLAGEITYTEIHPDGPIRNDAFSITVRDDNAWIAYGGYNAIYNFSGRNLGISGLYNKKWYNIPHANLNVRDITKVEINPFDSKKIYIASYLNGVVLATFDELDDRWKKTERWIPETTGNGIPETTIPGFNIVSYLAIDNNSKLWVSNLVSKNYEFMSRYNFSTDAWETKVNTSGLYGTGSNDVRIVNIFIHKDGNVFCGTKSNGLLVYKESYDQSLPVGDDNNKIEALNTTSSKGALPSNNVRAVVVDDRNKIWVGTATGLVVFDDYENLYNTTKRPASKVIINENGVGKELLSTTQVNDIIIDQAGNKWFATQGAGVFHTSSDGQTTYNIFNTSNSPLPKNTVIDLELDKSTGLLYMVTDKGVVSYDTDIEPFGTKITAIVAYPNPAIRNQFGHENITIVAKDGNGIPSGTNVKIIDVSGKLVYETNISTTDQSIGGKIVWDKTNLRGNPVVSGIYIVLLSSSDASQTTTTKIAIVN